MLMSQLKVHFSEQACQPLKNREHEHSEHTPRVWNSLPSSVTASQTLGTFRRRLKTHLFAVSLTYLNRTESALHQFFSNVVQCS